MQPTVAVDKEQAPVSLEHLERAVAHLCSLQWEGGYFEGEMVWNTMLLSQYVITQRIVGRWPIEGERLRLIVKHYEVTQREDGSWPMHGEGPGYVFFTTLAYVALRLLGLPADHPMLAKARAWLRRQPGGVPSVPSWGKFWLAMLRLYGWEGVNPIPPEIFLLPDSVPLHPNNYYNHTRYIYLGIGFLYGKRFSVDLGPLADELRGELYDRPYESIDFARHRHDIAATDLYVRPSLPLRLAWDALVQYERRPLKALRQKALQHCFERIQYEVFATRGQGLSPVNGLLNCLALYAEDPRHPELGPALDAMESWKWQDEAEGIRYCGAHSTAWDTAFAIRALCAAPAAERARAEVRRAYAWLKKTQMQEELPSREAQRRDPILGGWCFSDGEHRWPVSDCTAEALSAILAAHEKDLIPENERISDERLVQAVRFIMYRQNADGGFGSYERRRGAAILELVNPSEMYGNCMTERSYTECTASCVGALARFRAVYPTVERDAIDEAVSRGVRLLRSRQLPDGSYLGFWGVNFTYAIFHVIEALTAAGVPPSDPAIARAAEWLLTKQKADGGWGEHWKSCMTDSYVEHPESQAAMTAWALLALLEVLPPDEAHVARAARCLERLQGADGAWPHQAQSGIFFSTAMLDYRLYKDVFPTWALGRRAALRARS